MQLTEAQPRQSQTVQWIPVMHTEIQTGRSYTRLLSEPSLSIQTIDENGMSSDEQWQLETTKTDQHGKSDEVRSLHVWGQRHYGSTICLHIYITGS